MCIQSTPRLKLSKSIKYLTVFTLSNLSRHLSHRVMFWWAIGICHLVRSYYHADFFFLPHSLLVFPCAKYHKLVWYIYWKRNFVRMQHYFFAIFPFYGDDVSDYNCLDASLLRSWPRTESTSLPFPLMLQQRTLFPFLTSPAKRGLGVRDFILWSLKFLECIHLKF